jgi:hypothetical protein
MVGISRTRFPDHAPLRSVRAGVWVRRKNVVLASVFRGGSREAAPRPWPGGRMRGTVLTEERAGEG